MYRIAILDQDKAYLERLISFLREHHGEIFEINAGSSLDSMNTDVIRCDALFFGDDVVVDTALFPADIAIGYLTERSETDEQHINKYQSMEQICRQMTRVCEAGRNAGAVVRETTEKPRAVETQPETAGFGIKAETMTLDEETYRIYYIDEKQVDGLALRMLAGNHIKGLFQTEFRDGGVRICITGMKSLYEYIQKNNSARGKEQLLKFFADMIATARSLEEYMLTADRLMLDPKEIYVNQAEDRVLVPYIPVSSEQPLDSGQCLVKIRDLCNILLEGLAKGTPAAPDVKETMERQDNSMEKQGNSMGKGKDAAEISHDPQAKEKEDPKLQENTKTIRKGIRPYIVRKRTRERIVIDRTPFKLGKDAACVDYCIQDNPAVSRNHADIVRKADGFYLIDKGSLNHTFVNGKKLAGDEQRKLENGCLLQLANEVFEFRTK